MCCYVFIYIIIWSTKGATRDEKMIRRMVRRVEIETDKRQFEFDLT